MKGGGKMKGLMKRIFLMFLILPVVIGLAVANADALALDLTSPGSSGTINGTIFYTPLIDTSGPIDAFLQIQAGHAASEAGYNTDGTLEFETKSAHSLQLSAIQTNIVDIYGVNYYEFVLDVNESANNSLITLHDFEFYIDANSDNSGYPGIGTLVYDLDAGPQGDSSVTVDYNNFGAGNIDLFALVPTSYFRTDLTQYVYLYSSFGQPDDIVDDGVEEWAHKIEGTFTPPEPIPEPATALLFLMGIMGFLGIKRKRL
jgi:hypothetical protein